jgi:plasmid stabilization system protein ParE
MSYSVYFTQSADTDLDEILEFIAQDSPENALNFIDQLQSRIINTLEEQPFTGLRYQDFNYLSFDNYIVIYDVDQSNRAVYVHLITEGHRQWRMLLDTRF